jgi:hypothetical protein|tara:strand:+ start:147 stop:536 length:390 start_codon:yes stop_codon:yes gene_type:complete
MSIDELKNKLKVLKRQKIKLKDKVLRIYKKNLQEIDDKIYSTNLLIKSKETNTSIVYSSKISDTTNTKNPSTYPQNIKARKKRGLINIDLKKIANVEGGLQRINNSKYKAKPINRQAARAVGIYSKKKY